MDNQRLWVIVAVSILLVGCVGSNQPTAPPTDIQNPQIGTGLDANQFPPFPVDREATAVFNTEVFGNQYWEKSLNSLAADSYMQLPTPVPGGFEWCIYQFNAASSTVTGVDALWAASGAEGAYIGLANFSKGSWNFHGPSAEGGFYALDELQHMSPLGNYYVAVINPSTNPITVGKLTFSLEGDWQVVTVDNDPWVGTYSSMEVINGKPAIAYFDNLNNDLKYVRALDDSGLTWGEPTIPDSIHIGIKPSLALIDNNPAIAYYNWVEDLWYVRASDTSGDEWYPPVQVDSDGLHGKVGKHPSLAVVDGKPAISYGAAETKLKYCRSIDVSGDAWGSPLTIDNGMNLSTDWYTTLIVENDVPVVCYWDEETNDGSLALVAGTDAAGTSWNPPQPVDFSSGNNGKYASGALVNSMLSISYYNQNSADLIYTYWNNLASEWRKVVVDGTDNVGQHTSLTVINGNPAISYYDNTNGNLKYARAIDAKGTAWGTPVTVDSNGNVGEYTSLSEVNGKAAISYYDGYNATLKYAIQLDP